MDAIGGVATSTLTELEAEFWYSNRQSQGDPGPGLSQSAQAVGATVRAPRLLGSPRESTAGRWSFAITETACPSLEPPRLHGPASLFRDRSSAMPPSGRR